MCEAFHSGWSLRAESCWALEGHTISLQVRINYVAQCGLSFLCFGMLHWILVWWLFMRIRSPDSSRPKSKSYSFRCDRVTVLWLEVMWIVVIVFGTWLKGLRARWDSALCQWLCTFWTRRHTISLQVTINYVAQCSLSSCVTAAPDSPKIATRAMCKRSWSTTPHPHATSNSASINVLTTKLTIQITSTDHNYLNAMSKSVTCH